MGRGDFAGGIKLRSPGVGHAGDHHRVLLQEGDGRCFPGGGVSKSADAEDTDSILVQEDPNT